MRTHWIHVGRGAAGLGAAMGIGRFADTPILPLMTAQAALTPQAAGTLATANYVGYLAGALAGAASPRLARSTLAWRASLAVLVVSLAAMPLLPNTIGWLLVRTVAGFASAVAFVIAVNSMLEHLPPHLPGWGFGGVGLGIALSGALVLTLPAEAGWQGAWWSAAALAAVLSAAVRAVVTSDLAGGSVAAMGIRSRQPRHFEIQFWRIGGEFVDDGSHHRVVFVAAPDQRPGPQRCRVNPGPPYQPAGLRRIMPLRVVEHGYAQSPNVFEKRWARDA
ncbi:MAG TPA: YbfB/YjiJ family MFS transporter [Mycobacterium sp.]|nr:YbfB/YjiJ family MFS transporter [Mycobacterium sp.]